MTAKEKPAAQEPTDNSILPSRYTGEYEKALMTRIAEKANGNTAANGKAKGEPFQLWPRVKPFLVPLVAGLVLLFWTFGGRTQATNSKLAITKTPLMSSEAAGLAPRPEDMLPAQPVAPAAAATATTDSSTMTPAMPVTRGDGAVGQQPKARAAVKPTACAQCERAAQQRALGLKPTTDVLFDDSTESEFGGHITAVEEAAPQRIVLNIGASFEAEIAGAIRAPGSGIPVTAVVTKDVPVGTRVAIPAGARLVGTAFSTLGDDRVQVIFTSLVRNGKTYTISALAFATAPPAGDGGLGLPGKVIQKPKGKKLFGTVLGAGASVLGAGFLGRQDVAGMLLNGVASNTASQISNMSFQFQRDPAKVVETGKASTISVYLNSDLDLAS